MDLARYLIKKHLRHGVLVDTNLMVLLLVGIVNPERIQTFKRTSKYSLDDFQRLIRVVDQFRTRYVTPGIMAELSNLTDLKGEELESVRDHFRIQTSQTAEHYLPAKDVTTHPAFSRLGFTDASICELAERPVLVLTDDVTLHIWLEERGLASINFTWLRSIQ